MSETRIARVARSYNGFPGSIVRRGDAFLVRKAPEAGRWILFGGCDGSPLNIVLPGGSVADNVELPETDLEFIGFVEGGEVGG